MTHSLLACPARWHGNIAWALLCELFDLAPSEGARFCVSLSPCSSHAGDSAHVELSLACLCVWLGDAPWFADTASMPRARVTRCLVHYKKMREIGAAICGKNIHDAISYLNKVLEKQAGIPARVHTGGCGRHSVGKQIKAPGNSVMFPTKPTKAMIWILNNVLAGKVCEGFTEDVLASLRLVHVQVNRSSKMRRRTYRAHGRISAYMRSPCHVEVIAKPDDMAVPSEATKEEKQDAPRRLTRKTMARMRLRIGNGATA